MQNDLWQNLSTVQSGLQPGPNTLASTTTINPTSFITLVSGTIDVETVTPPVAGQHMIVLVFTDVTPGSLLTTGNIPVGSTTLAQDVPMLLFYNPFEAIYYLK